MASAGKASRINRTEAALRALSTSKDPRPLTRGRAGVWVPGAKLPPLCDYRGTQPTEDALGMRIMGECRLRRGKYPALLRLTHIPNGGKRGKIEAARMKAQGVRAGFPDYNLPEPRGIYHGLYFELKRHDGSMTGEQRVELEQLDAAGYLAACCWGEGAAMALMLWYLDGGETKAPWEIEI